MKGRRVCEVTRSSLIYYHWAVFCIQIFHSQRPFTSHSYIWKSNSSCLILFTYMFCVIISDSHSWLFCVEMYTHDLNVQHFGSRLVLCAIYQWYIDFIYELLFCFVWSFSSVPSFHHLKNALSGLVSINSMPYQVLRSYCKCLFSSLKTPHKIRGRTILPQSWEWSDLKRRNRKKEKSCTVNGTWHPSCSRGRQFYDIFFHSWCTFVSFCKRFFFLRTMQ